MGCVAEIMTKDEALALPPADRPICFRIPSKLYHAIFENVGAASMCWKPDTGSAEFDASRAEKVALTLCFETAKTLEEAGVVYEKWPPHWR